MIQTVATVLSVVRSLLEDLTLQTGSYQQEMYTPTHLTALSHAQASSAQSPQRIHWTPTLHDLHTLALRK